MLLALFALADPPAEPAPEPTLDGRTFQVTVQHPDNGAMSETFVFAAGTMDAREHHQWGFVAGPYVVRVVPGALAFTATLASPRDGELTWSGTVIEMSISGSAEWRRPGKPRMHYGFEGTERK